MIYERTNIIPIPQISPTSKKEKDNTLEKEYGLKENVFDPSKFSPPNSFMLKLKQRMTLYESFINDDKRNTE